MPGPSTTTLMEAGNLQRRITLRTPTDVTNAEGLVTTTYTNYRSCWADIEPLVGTELMAAAQISADLTVKVTIRYSKQTRPRDQILYGTRIFEIHSVVDEREDHVKMVLLCEELGNE